MSSPTAGPAKPRIRVVPTAPSPDGDDALFLAEALGTTADPWQADVIRAWLATTKAGLAAPQCGLSVPRQNGKTVCLEIVEFYKLTVQGRKILHTSHEVESAQSSFRRLRDLFEHPDVAMLVDWRRGGIRRSNGQESITLKNGGLIKFRTRTRGGARGATFDDLVLDEAQEMTDEQFDALSSTVAAAPSGDSQIIMTGTPPGPRADGAPFRKLRDAARNGGAGIAWHEWSPANVPEPGDNQGLLDIARACNPTFGQRIPIKSFTDALVTMAYQGFLRERCGHWDVALGITPWRIIPESDWEAAAVTAGPADGLVAFGVKFSVDGHRVGLAGAVKHAGGVHVEALGVSPMPQGARLLVPWLVNRPDTPVWIDGRSGADDFAAQLAAHGIPARFRKVLDTKQAIAAHQGLLRALDAGELTHADQPGLNAAVKAMVRRKIGPSGGFGWESADERIDITPLDAVTLAHYGAEQIREPKEWKGAFV